MQLTYHFSLWIVSCWKKLQGKRICYNILDQYLRSKKSCMLEFMLYNFSSSFSNEHCSNACITPTPSASKVCHKSNKPQSAANYLACQPCEKFISSLVTFWNLWGVPSFLLHENPLFYPGSTWWESNSYVADIRNMTTLYVICLDYMFSQADSLCPPTCADPIGQFWAEVWLPVTISVVMVVIIR